MFITLPIEARLSVVL